MNFSRGIQATKAYRTNWLEFKHHYGASPGVVAVIWNDLCTTDIAASKLSDDEKNQRGLKYLLMVIYFLFNYPRSRHSFKKLFDVNDKYASGKFFWTWVSRIAGLKEKVIKFPEEFSDPNGRPFIMSLDCRDHKVWEKKHPRFNLDRNYSSHKHGMHAALKYELGLALFSDQICWISGPYNGKRSDLTIFRTGGLKQKCLQECPGKYVVADLGYRSSEPDETMLLIPNSKHPLPLKKFLSLGRCREEDMNARMAKWKVLSHEFEHSIAKHEICYVSVAVIIQYQLDNDDAFLTKL